MINWIKVYEKQDLSGLLKVKGKIDRFAYRAYERLQDQIVDAFGISEDFLKVLRKKVAIESMYAKQFITGNRSNQMLIDIAELELEDMIKDQPKKADIQESVIFIEKQMGFHIPLNQITVEQFYSYSKFVNKMAR